MYLIRVLTFITLSVYFVNTMETGYLSKFFPFLNNPYEALATYNIDEPQKVKVQLYYETLCPFSRDFAIKKFVPTIKKLNKYLDILAYPFGKATIIKEKDGSVSFKCQHGPLECYGNKLHSCAIDMLENITMAMEYNACMMDFRFDTSSDDEAADQCEKSMKINSEPIKDCAKSDKGTQLLINYGGESAKAGFHYVPYVLINGKKFDIEENFFETVCSFFTSSPPPCKSVLL